MDNDDLLIGHCNWICMLMSYEEVKLYAYIKPAWRTFLNNVFWFIVLFLITVFSECFCQKIHQHTFYRNSRILFFKTVNIIVACYFCSSICFSLGSTVLLLLPSSVHLLVKPSIKRFKLALVRTHSLFIHSCIWIHELLSVFTNMFLWSYFFQHQVRDRY